MPAAREDRYEVRLPIACSLDGTEVVSRQGECEQLLASHAIDGVEIDHGVRCRLRASEEVRQEFQRPVDLERGCCPWTTWNLYEEASSLVLDATAETEEGVKLLRFWFEAFVPDEASMARDRMSEELKRSDDPAPELGSRSEVQWVGRCPIASTRASVCVDVQDVRGWPGRRNPVGRVRRPDRCCNGLEDASVLVDGSHPKGEGQAPLGPPLSPAPLGDLAAAARLRVPVK